MTDNDRELLRRKRNAYNSALVASRDYISGKTLVARKTAETELRILLWIHREALIEAVSREGVS